MKIVHLVAGAGGMYCGACLHANTLVVALREEGHDALLAPAYTPLRLDEENSSLDRVVFGGINVYLQQVSALFRRTPWFLDRLLDHPGLLRWAGQRASATNPASLGPMAVSMLAGGQGRQRKELDKLVDWLRGEIRPDVVHLSTALLAAVADPIGRQLAVPVVATLSGEDSFLERLPQPYRGEAIGWLSTHCRHLDGIVAMNDYYADFMARYLAIPRQRIDVIRPGLKLAGHRLAPREGRAAEFTIGFLARICPEKGLHLLADAFCHLAAEGSLPPLRLVAAGHLGRLDRPYLAAIQSRLAACGLGDRFQYAGEPDRVGKIELLESMDLFCLPTVYPESKGLPVLEAWANGVPVVAADHGTFSELLVKTGGGLLCRPNDPDSLADVLRRLIVDPALAARCGGRGAEAIRNVYHAPRMAREMLALYGRLASAGEGARMK